MKVNGQLIDAMQVSGTAPIFNVTNSQYSSQFKIEVTGYETLFSLTDVNGYGGSAFGIRNGSAAVTFYKGISTPSGQISDLSSTTANIATLTAGTVKTNSWSIQPPDYVFEKDYKLASLENVEKFVDKHKHLPEIPSAKEMKAKGLDLAEMNLKLLKKVEELTLYAIKQEKRDQKHEQQISELKKAVMKMKERVSRDAN
jgi:hypothetical protein